MSDPDVTQLLHALEDGDRTAFDRIVDGLSELSELVSP